MSFVFRIGFRGYLTFYSRKGILFVLFRPNTLLAAALVKGTFAACRHQFCLHGAASSPACFSGFVH